MGILSDRFRVVSTSLSERFRHGLIKTVGPVDREVLFILDGVGRFQFAPLIVRKVIRDLNASLGTIMYDWQFGPTGVIFTDLIWLKRNRLMAAKLARSILRLRREQPNAMIHLLGYSGGGGVAVMACEHLIKRRIIDTLLLVAPALSPSYNLALALRAVERCYSLVSQKDRWLLGAGTSIFGTIDRQFSPAAGQVGFQMPEDLDDFGKNQYSRLREIHWSPSLQQDGPSGGHIGWMSERFLRKHLLPILSGQPLIESTPVRR